MVQEIHSRKELGCLSSSLVSQNIFDCFLKLSLKRHWRYKNTSLAVRLTRKLEVDISAVWQLWEWLFHPWLCFLECNEPTVEVLGSCFNFKLNFLQVTQWGRWMRIWGYIQWMLYKTDTKIHYVSFCSAFLTTSLKIPINPSNHYVRLDSIYKNSNISDVLIIWNYIWMTIMLEESFVSNEGLEIIYLKYFPSTYKAFQ